MFRDMLRRLRNEKGYSMDDLVAEYNGRYDAKMNKSTLSRYENGLQEPMYSTVANLAKIFGVTVDFLIDENYTGWEDKESARKPLSDVKLETAKNPYLLTIEENFQKLNETGQEHLAEYSSFLASKKEYQKPVETVRVFRAARSTDNAPPEWVDMPAEDVERIFSAPESDIDL